MLDVKIIGVKELADWVHKYPEVINKAQKLALNDATRYAHGLAKKRITQELNFLPSYLGAADNPASRLRIKKYATDGSLDTSISGRVHPTSLARFANTRVIRKRKTQPLKVSVRRGQSKELKRAFLLRLRSGASIEGSNNIGLAIRLPNGVSLRKGKGRKLSGNRKTTAWLLYGPSVDQAFGLVREDIAEPVAQRLKQQLTRQIARLL